jgi:hypothetical protein
MAIGAMGVIGAVALSPSSSRICRPPNPASLSFIAVILALLRDTPGEYLGQYPTDPVSDV